MSLSKPVMTVKDTVTFILNDTDLLYKRVGEVVKTPERNVLSPDGLKWWVELYPAGYTVNEIRHISVFLYVNNAVSAKYNFKVDRSTVQSSSTFNFGQCKGSGFYKFATHEALRPLFVSGKLSITCAVEFDVSVPFSFLTLHLAQYCGYLPTDFELVVGTNRVQVHKSLLSLISPVFHAIISHDTVESKSDRVEITGFDFATVKTVIDFCYGKDLPTPSVEVVILMLRFADKYVMKAVANQLEKMPRQSLTTTTYPAIVHYAYDCAKGPLLVECTKFFKQHEAEIKTTQAFVNLPLTVVVHILKSAFDLKTYADVFQHARNNNFAFVNERLQNLSSVSFDTFFIAVSYAWANSCDNLKKACATFYNDHRDAVMSINAFLDLTPEVVYGVIKLGFELKMGLK